MNSRLPVLPSGTRFNDALSQHELPPLQAGHVTWLQVNLGKRCNQACHHCHVEAGPQRTESMDGGTVDRLIELMGRSNDLELLDITGGAPELNPHFRRLVEAARSLGLRVIDRCNLTILSEPGQEDLADFLAAQGVDVVASLPCYLEPNVDGQRGGGVFARSIEGLTRLNDLGYGHGDSGLRLDLVYNPTGPFLPPAQDELEADYKAQLNGSYGLVFDSLITITNMPVARFRHSLERDRKLAAYERLLRESFNPATVSGLMCRSLVSVSWDGRLFDCDFNQMLELASTGPSTLWELNDLSGLDHRSIGTAEHCFGCTAGSGSSCAGTLD